MDGDRYDHDNNRYDMTESASGGYFKAVKELSGTQSEVSRSLLLAMVLTNLGTCSSQATVTNSSNQLNNLARIVKS